MADGIPVVGVWAEEIPSCRRKSDSGYRLLSQALALLGTNSWKVNSHILRTASQNLTTLLLQGPPFKGSTTYQCLYLEDKTSKQGPLGGTPTTWLNHCRYSSFRHVFKQRIIHWKIYCSEVHTVQSTKAEFFQVKNGVCVCVVYGFHPMASLI